MHYQKHSTESIAKMVKAHVGHKHSEEQKAKISLASKRLWDNPEYKNKMNITRNSDEYKTNMRLAQIGKIITEEQKQKTSDKMKAIWANPEYKARVRESRLGFKHSEESIKKMSEAKLGHEVSSEARAKLRDANLGKILTEEHKAKISKSEMGRIVSEETKAKHREWWGNPGNKERAIKAWIKASHIRPNVPEIALGKMLDELYPNEWKYTGDGSVIIGGLIPDYLNVNGEKKTIELYGEYWHTGERVGNWKRTEKGRVKAFKSFGFDCLVIWESELDNRDKVLEKIREYHDK